ncbi:tRNA dihydrouridine synthase DusB [archaeon]|jgi:tRNA-dihydrouridine synthase B|nr:tRNA dihydrouridine synthase DusB [archaeon]
MKLPKFKSKVFLAPMAGFTDPAFRLICKKNGAGLVVTELISANSIVAKKDKIKEFIQFSKKEKPNAVQLFGSDLKLLKKAVKIVEPHFDIIDYNMGCPSPNITNQMAGAALLQEPELTRKIFKVLVSSTIKPITLKMRSGKTKPNKFLEIAKIAEEEGIQMITLHPRTVKQGYSGNADWSLIKKLKDSVKIPVVGNGDIRTPEDAKKMFDETGCDYIMVGRAAKGNPFIFKQINDYLKKGEYDELSFEKKLKIFNKYLSYSRKFTTKFTHVKLHAIDFTKCRVGGNKIREKLATSKTIKEIKELLSILEK